MHSQIRCASREDAEALRVECLKRYPNSKVGEVLEETLALPTTFWEEIPT